MIFKVFFRTNKRSNEHRDETFCRVIAVENGQMLENRINNIILNLKADGYETVEILDCFNISESDNKSTGHVL